MMCCGGRASVAAVGEVGYLLEESKDCSMNGGRWMVLNSAASAEEGERLANRKWITPAGDRERMSARSSSFFLMAMI